MPNIIAPILILALALPLALKSPFSYGFNLESSINAEESTEVVEPP
jgi:hypothetical protein